MGVHATCLQCMWMENSYEYLPRFGTLTFELANPFGLVRVGGTIDMLNFTFFM